MLRLILTLAALVMFARPADAHFLFIHVVKGEKPRIEAHFAESCWDFSADQRMVTLMSDLKGWDPRHGTITFTPRPHAMIGDISSEGTTACGSFTYGIMRRGGEFLLEYHAKGVCGIEAASTPAGLDAEIIAELSGPEVAITVLFKGEAVPGAEIVVPMEGSGIATLTTDDRGRITIPRPDTPLFSIRAMVPERRDGVHEDVEYGEVRHYTTLTVHPEPEPEGPRGDAMANALLADAMTCNGTIAPGISEWSGRLQGRFADEEIRGNVTHDASGTTIALASNAPSTARSQLPILAGIGDAGGGRAMNARFPRERFPRVGSTIETPDSGQVFILRDRRIESVVTPHEDGTRRVDVVEWMTTDDLRFVPVKMLLTDFDQDGAITAVVVLETGFTVQNGFHRPGSLTGTIIDGPSEGNAFSLKVNDLRVK